MQQFSTAQPDEEKKTLLNLLASTSLGPSLTPPWVNEAFFYLCATSHPMADRDLFNAAFLSCWSELSEDQQDELIRSIELALTSQDIAEVTQTLLNLAEFMEHSDKVGVGEGRPFGATVLHLPSVEIFHF